MEKKIYHYKNNVDKIKEGLDTIARPVSQTLSPKGRNVLFQNEFGDNLLTNDGVTIAKEISVKDELVNSIINIVKGSALKTNSEGGDGTTSTIVLSEILTLEALKLLDEGHSWIEIRDGLNQMGISLLKNIDKKKFKIKNDKDLHNVAFVSANSDKEIAQHIVDVVKTAGEDGMVFLEPSNKPKTEVLKDYGYMIKEGILYEELAMEEGMPIIKVNNVPTLLTDKKIYYEEEANAILKIAIEQGWSTVAIIAKEFLNEALPVFLVNHKKNINIVLIKDPMETDDLALYLGGHLITEKTGNLVENITADDFIFCSSIYQDPQKTLISPKTSPSRALKSRVKYIKSELEKDKDNQILKNRLSSLTNGIVTIKIAGATGIELREKIYRYEDAVNATRMAMKHGYLIGGGISIFRAFNKKDYTDVFRPVAKKFTEAILRQVAKNCGKFPDTVIEDIGKLDYSIGYNALTDKYEDLLKVGVFDAYIVTKLAIENSISVANTLVSIDYYLINNLDDENERESRRDKNKERTRKA